MRRLQVLLSSKPKLTSLCLLHGLCLVLEELQGLQGPQRLCLSLDHDLQVQQQEQAVVQELAEDELFDP